VDGDTLTAVVPDGIAPGLYDVIIVNPAPSAEVGILFDGYTAVADPPPEIEDVVPPSISALSGQSVEVLGFIHYAEHLNRFDLQAWIALVAQDLQHQRRLVGNHRGLQRGPLDLKIVAGPINVANQLQRLMRHYFVCRILHQAILAPYQCQHNRIDRETNSLLPGDIPC